MQYDQEIRNSLPPCSPNPQGTALSLTQQNKNAGATDSLVHKAEVSGLQRGKPVRPEAPHPPSTLLRQQGHHCQEVRHYLPTAAEQWLREFAQGERQAIGTEGSEALPKRNEFIQEQCAKVQP